MINEEQHPTYSFRSLIKNKGAKCVTFQTMERIPTSSGKPCEAIFLNSFKSITFLDNWKYPDGVKSQRAINQNAHREHKVVFEH